MVKAKYKPMYLIIIILTVLLFVGYFNAKKAYASELNEVYTLEEIYDKYDIPEGSRLNLNIMDINEHLLQLIQIIVTFILYVLINHLT